MTGCQDDHSLVQACRAGQREAFGLLVRRYQDRLYPILARLVGWPEDAQDILQDAFVRAFEKLDQFHGESSFYTWVYRIAVNLALSRHRQRQGRHQSQLFPSTTRERRVEPADLSPEADPAWILERAEREAIIEAALEKLAPEHRAVILLKDFDGCRYEEISLLLNIPLGTVRSRIHRARSELRRHLLPLVERTEERVLEAAEKAVDA